jgi:uncharacterized membrane protein YqiK
MLGEAQAILAKAQASAESVNMMSEAIRKQGEAGKDALSLSVAEKYMDAFGQIAKEGTTVVVPSSIADA